MKKAIFEPGISAAVGGVRTPGQGAQLLLGKKFLRNRQDTSGISSLTQPAQELERPVIPSGEQTFRNPCEVTQGLGLDYDTQRTFESKLRQWAQEGNVINFRRSLMEDLRSLSPNDYAFRSEAARRAIAFYKNTAENRFERKIGREGTRLIIQKSNDSDLKTIRPKLLLRRSEHPLEMVWCCEEVSDELVRSPENLPPGWSEDDLAKAAKHKYLKKTAKTKFRYFYKVPSQKELVSSGELAAGSKFKANHEGQVGHFEVIFHHPDEGEVIVRHDESGRTVRMKESELQRLMKDQVNADVYAASVKHY